MRFILLLSLISLSVFAELKLPAIFSDGMVLQNGIDVPIWGWADNGKSVSVSFAGQTKSTTAKDGKWIIKLSPLKVNAKNAKLTVSSDAKTITIKNVLVGEVWVCSGQSNMDFTIAAISKDAREKQYQPVVDYIRAETKTATDPLLRQITVPRISSYTKPMEDFQGTWIESNAQNNPTFSATGYFFARELRKELNVPIGLIKCPWGGTLVEPWDPQRSIPGKFR